MRGLCGINNYMILDDPNIEVIGIENTSEEQPWASTDALHCRTHEVPDFNAVFIDHRDVLSGQEHADIPKGSAQDQVEFTVETAVTAYSGAGLKDNSPELGDRVLPELEGHAARQLRRHDVQGQRHLLADS